MSIRMFEPKDLSAVIRIWNESVARHEVVYYPLTEQYFHKKFEGDPNYDPQYSLVATNDKETVVGFINGVAKRIFLGNEGNSDTPGFLTCVFVDRSHRGLGFGTELVNALGERFLKNGKTVYSCSGDNPINLDWIVPGTENHDHNNAPGMDVDCMGYAFLQKLGFTEKYREIAMYLNLKDYAPWDELDARRESLRREGIETGRYDASLDYEYDGMCDRVKSEYWRSVLKTEIACHKEHKPCTDIRFIPNGKVPKGPRPILAATHDRHIVSFTGPVDLQQSGRGWFSGICTDPLFERRGIASVLFNLLMREFIKEGASFSTLFTGDSNHAQRIYARAGFKIARRFVIMSKPLIMK